MKRMQMAALLLAGFLIWQPEILGFLVERTPVAGYSIGELESKDRITVLFWSAVVFVFFLVRFQDWATVRPPDFAHTPTRHCTTQGRYLFAQASYAMVFVGAFWILIFVPQLLDLLRQALELLWSGGAPAEMTKPAFPDPDLKDTLDSSVRPLAEFNPVQAAPYVCVLMLLVYPRYAIPVVGEARIRAFFQERALIPREAHRQINRIGDARGAGVFCPDEKTMLALEEDALNGLLDLSRYRDEPALHDIVLAEYLHARIAEDDETSVVRARRDSDFQELSANLEQARHGLGELVNDAHELIKALEADDAGKVDLWRARVMTALDGIRQRSQDLSLALTRRAEGGAQDWPVLTDRVRQDALDLKHVLSSADTELGSLDALMVLDDHAAYEMEQTKDALRQLIAEQTLAAARFASPLVGLDDGAVRDLTILAGEMREVLTLAEAVGGRIDEASKRAQQQEVTLDWVEHYRRSLKPGTRQRLFSRAMDNRRKEVLTQYRLLRAQMTRLLATLVLASDSSPMQRERHLRSYGFGVKTSQRGNVRVQQYAIPLTFSVVFVLSLATTLLYSLDYGVFEDLGADLFGLGQQGVQDTLNAVPLDHPLMVKDEKAAAYWAFVASLLQMFGVLMALFAWNLLTDEERSTANHRSRGGVLINAWFNGFVFGFVGGVIVFYLLGLILNSGGQGQTMGPGLLRAVWPWAIMAGITGGFLLVQGIHVHDKARRAFIITIAIQGLVSCLAAGTIAWLWTPDTTPDRVVGAFSLYSAFNMLVLGSALGFVALFVMQSEDLEIDAAGCGESDRREPAET